MNKTIYKQADSRWAKDYYPRKGYTVGGSGCGLLACVHVAMEQESKKNWTPKNLRAWMVSKGFAKAGQGTKWEGITQTLQYLGHKTVVRVYDKDPMTKAWEELNKGNRIGVLLLDSHKAPDGRKFTASGHYIAFTDYKVVDKKHWFYLKDSSWRNNSGWLCYEKSIKGCLPKLWIVERVKEEPKKVTVTSGETYKGDLPAVEGGTRLVNFEASQKGKYATRSNSGKDGKKYSNKFTKYFAGRGGIDSKGQMPNVYGYIPGYCTLFACYCVEMIGEAAQIPFKVLISKAKGYWWHAPSLMKYYKGKKMLVSYKKAKKGAIAFKGDKSPTHTCTFVKYENGYVYTWDGNVGGGVSYNKRKPSAFCGFVNLPLHNYFGEGSKGPDVLKWQKFLNWFNGKQVVAEDGDFGEYTVKFTKAFQLAVGLKDDGLVGSQSVAKAKTVRR